MYCKSSNDQSRAFSVIRFASLFGVLMCSTLSATELPEGIQIHGFASQAYISTSENNFFGDTSNDEHFGFTEIGLNGSAVLNPSLQIAAQLLSRRAGDGDDGRIRVDYSLIDYTAHSGTAGRWGLRAGRILNSLGFYNETRDMPFTRPSIFLPQSIYFDRTRDLALSSDGAHIYGEYRNGGNEIFFQLAAAQPRVDRDETERAVLGALRPGKLVPDTSILGHFLWETGGGRTRLSLSAGDVNMDYSPSGAGDILGNGSISFSPRILSAQYNAEKWSLTAEYARRKLRYKNFSVSQLNRSFTGESGYLQGVYRFARNWDAIMRYDLLFTDMEDRDGKDFSAANGVPAHTRFAKDWTVGIGWQPTPSLMVRAEFHKVKGTAWLPVADNPDPGQTAEHWNMFALQASFRF